MSIIPTPIPQIVFPHLEPSLLAIIVLYKMAPMESEAVLTLLKIFKSHPHLARHFCLILYDNSPEPQPIELPLPVATHYKHDPTNQGLAAAYNYALAYALETEHEWLLLLDQDTSLTLDYVVELIARALEMGADQHVGSLVPRLLANGQIHSPAAHFVDQVRRQYRRTGHTASADLVGMQSRRMGAYNSGSAFKVAALRTIGGFPEEYWLDYLDHAIFHALFVHGFRMYIMRAMLEHDPSQAHPGDVPIWRERNLLIAQARFVRETGNWFDRILYRIWLLRRSRSRLLCFPHKGLWKEAALQALLWKRDYKDGEHGKKKLPT